jgi:hypothetical protein
MVEMCISFYQLPAIINCVTLIVYIIFSVLFPFEKQMYLFIIYPSVSIVFIVEVMDYFFSYIR